jgi:histidinol-phosphate/aromatic aminotransferase/cobyric acid decarboxylase-like protein
MTDLNPQTLNDDAGAASAPEAQANPVQAAAVKPKRPPRKKPESAEALATAFARFMSPEELQMERDRIYARLTSIPNVVSRPSPSDYVVFEVGDPSLVLKKLASLGVPADVVQKYPKIQNGLRVFVRSAKQNEEFLRALEQAAR